MKKLMVLTIVSMIGLAVAGHCEEQKLPEGFTLVTSSGPYKMVLTPYVTYPVILEEYVPEVILKGVIGSGPGEFGSLADWNEGDLKHYMPQSLALNSKGEIYMLDAVNNRIQKLDNNGRYIKSIPVPGLRDKKGNSISQDNIRSVYTEGINVLVDPEDNLYYYNRNGRKKGQVRKYVNDRFVKKWEVPFVNNIHGINLNDEGKVYVSNISNGAEYDVVNETYSVHPGRDSYEIKSQDYYMRIEKAHKEDKYLSKLIIIDRNSNKILNQVVYSGGNREDVNIHPKIIQGKIMVNNIFYIDKQIRIFIDKFGEDGMLVSTAEISDNVYSSRFKSDASGNLYQIYQEEERFKLIKWHRRK